MKHQFIRIRANYTKFNRYITKWKVKWSRYRPGVAQKVGRGIVLLFHDHDTRRGWVVSSTPQPHFTPREKGKTCYPFYRRLGGPHGRSGRAENLVPTGIQSWTVQPVVSRYTNWATQPTLNYCYFPKTSCYFHVFLHRNDHSRQKRGSGPRIMNWYGKMTIQGKKHLILLHVVYVVGNFLGQ